MKTHFYTRIITRLLSFLLLFCAVLSAVETHAQATPRATFAVPVSIGSYACTNGKGFVQFNYVSDSLKLRQLDPTSCNLSNLASPGFYEYNSGISFNPADTNLYYIRYEAPHTYVWRWKPGSSCPPSTALLRVYNNTYVVGLTFDANGLGYQLIYTGSLPSYGLALQSVDFATGTLGPIKNISLPSGLNQLQGNGDFVITPTGQFLAILDNNYITVNYEDYHTSTPLKATLITKITGNKIIGLSYSDGKLVASDYYNYSGKYRSNYYEIGIVDGSKTTITTAPCYFSTDMTDINTAIGVSKKLSSVVPTGTAGQYDICYDIYVQNYGNWPLENVSLQDNLGQVFQNNNISNVSVSLIDNPAGVTLDPTFNGRTGGTGKRELLAAGTKLPAAPSANNHFTIRICLRVSNIVIGKVYNNTATAEAYGYLNARVRDESTDGDNPDLNNNGKPDDPGENQPTPFVISVAAEMPPCDALNRVLYMQNFGNGGNTTSFPAATGSAGTPSTTYSGTTSYPLNIEQYSLTNNASNGYSGRWISRTDHTTGSGRMMVVNADVQNNVIYKDRVNIPCTNLKYSLFAFVSNIANSTYETFCTDAFGNIVYPKLNFIVRKPDGTVITNLTTPEITSSNWTQFGMKFVMPAGITQVDIEIRNVAAGGCGNDLAIDDIQFGLCDPTPTVNINSSAGCSMGITTFSAELSDPTVISGALDYQWQISSNGTTWADIPMANGVTYTINPLQPSDIGKYYRVIVAAAGNISNTACRYISNAFLLNAKNASAAPTGVITDPAATTCPENPVTLTVNGGSLGTNAQWRWYTGSCGGTLIGTGSSIIVSPAVTTTYYVRAEGDCNTTSCASITITVSPCVILPIEFQQFSAVYRSKAIDLSWRIASSEQINHFVIERSVDGSHFEVVHTMASTMAANTTASFSYSDVDINFDQPVYYYRVKVVGKNGTNKYSNILSVKLGVSQLDKMKVSPNPASTAAAVMFKAAVRGMVDYKVIDMTGKIVWRGQQRMEAGANTIQLSELGRLSEGVYTIMLYHSGRWEYERLVIKR